MKSFFYTYSDWFINIFLFIWFVQGLYSHTVSKKKNNEKFERLQNQIDILKRTVIKEDSMSESRISTCLSYCIRLDHVIHELKKQMNDWKTNE